MSPKPDFNYAVYGKPKMTPGGAFLAVGFALILIFAYVVAFLGARSDFADDTNKGSQGNLWGIVQNE